MYRRAGATASNIVPRENVCLHTYLPFYFRVLICFAALLIFFANQTARRLWETSLAARFAISVDLIIHLRPTFDSCHDEYRNSTVQSKLMFPEFLKDNYKDGVTNCHSQTESFRTDDKVCYLRIRSDICFIYSWTRNEVKFSFMWLPSLYFSLERVNTGYNDISMETMILK